MVHYIDQVVDAPKAIGPYSQAVWAGQYLFISGQVPIDPSTGNLISNDIAQQTEQVLKNIKAILINQELSFSHIAKTTIYLTDLKTFQIVNQVYENLLGECRPARATIGVSALPLGSQVEIEVIAFR